MSIINIKNLSFCYEGASDNIFDNVSLRLDTDWRLGLTGRNGTGKTTLLRLLLGELNYSGEVYSSVNFQYFPSALDYMSLTVKNISSNIVNCAEEWQIRREFNKLNLREDILDIKADELSSGELAKVMLALLFLRKDVYLLIDEPTNHLDISGRKAVANYLKDKHSYILVSHDKYFMDSCIDHIMSINRTDIEVRTGNLSDYLNEKRLIEKNEKLKNERLNIEIEGLKESSRRASAWADKGEKEKFNGKLDNGLKPDRGHLGAVSAKMMKRAKAVQHRADKLIEEKLGLLKNVERNVPITLNALSYRSERLIEVKDLVISYNGKAVNSPLSFEILRGDRIALVGGNGSGKSSVIKALLKIISPSSGSIKTGSGLKVSYVSQDTREAHGTLDEFCMARGIDKTLLTTILYKFGLGRKQFNKRLEEHSEGQKKKVLLAGSLAEEAELYIWDEPLNYIDVISREQIKNMILSSDANMLFVEHDKVFQEEVATKTVKLGDK
jgi:lincosamide and streptogramin A transport system ATP-binding/permease protein